MTRKTAAQSEQELAEQYQKTLEAVGVPTNQARDAAVLLALEQTNPDYKRTDADKQTVSSAWHWWSAKGHQTLE